MSTDRTIARLWRDAVARRSARRRLPRPARRPLARGHLGRGGRARREPRERPPRARRPQGRGVRDARPHDARVGAVRLRAGAGRSGRRADLRRTARRRTPRTSSTTRSRSACSARTPPRSPRSRRSAARCRGCATCSPSTICRGSRRRARVFKAEHPSALDDAVAAIDEDDLFTFIYTSGTTGPPKGCMISHRNYYAMASVIDHLPGYVRDDDLMLLYLPLAHNFGRLMHLTGPYVGYTIAFLPDPLQTADALADGAPHRAAERSARVREDPHGRRRRDRRDDGRQAPARRLVARGRSRGRQARRRRACPSAACCS